MLDLSSFSIPISFFHLALDFTVYPLFRCSVAPLIHASAQLGVEGGTSKPAASSQRQATSGKRQDTGQLSIRLRVRVSSLVLEASELLCIGDGH